MRQTVTLSDVCLPCQCVRQLLTATVSDLILHRFHVRRNSSLTLSDLTLHCHRDKLNSALPLSLTIAITKLVTGHLSLRPSSRLFCSQRPQKEHGSQGVNDFVPDSARWANALGITVVQGQPSSRTKALKTSV